MSRPTARTEAAMAAALAAGPVLVTGASGGIGAAVARRLARPGARLVLTGRDTAVLEELAREVRARGARARVLPCDLRDAAAVAALAQEVLAREGAPSALLCCAGRSLHRPLERTFDRPDDLARMCAVNLVGTAGLILPLLEAMCAAGRGTVVAVTSASTRIPVPGWAAYGASKAGLDTWLRAVRPEAARRGVRLAVVEVPLVATAMSAPLYGTRPRGALTAEQAATLVLRALVPGRTLVSPLWARVGAPIAQAAPALSARAAEGAGRLALRIARRCA